MAALLEARQALLDGDCRRALAGGADSALHPVTWAELVREGYAEKGFVPAEGAGMLALAVDSERALAVLERCELSGPRNPSVTELLRPVLSSSAQPIDKVVIAPWRAPARLELRTAVRAYLPEVPVLDMGECLGDALAATPALAWVTALDLINAQEARFVLALNAGIDGGVGAVLLGRAA